VKGKSLKKLMRGEKGMALMIVLIIMLFGSLTITPVLTHISSELKIGQEVFEEKMDILYAADSGVEDALWQMENDQLNSDLFGGDDPEYDEYAYYSEQHTSYEWDYVLPSSINDSSVAVTFQNVWMPKDLTALDAAEARSIIEEGKLIIVGSTSGIEETEYQIKIAFYWANETERDSLRVQKIGVWLPVGFHYDDSCNLSGDCDPTSVDVEPYKSGEVVVWNFAYQPQLSVFPGGTSYPMVKTITFHFSGPEGQKPQAALSWIDTTGVGGIDYTWDADVQIYAVTSTATDSEGTQLTIDAYAATIEMRRLGAAVAGDYAAVGNTLLSHKYSSATKRDWLLRESEDTVTVADIPATATVQAAYLYWSGWIDYHFTEEYTDPWGHTYWGWGEIEELEYPEDPTQENLIALIEEAKVNRVSFGVAGAMEEFTTDQWQVAPITGVTIYEGTWFYGCFYDATDKVRQLIEDEDVGSNGSGTYIVKHADSIINVHRTGEGSDTYWFDLCDAESTTGDKTGYPLATPAHKLPYPPGERRYQDRFMAAYAGWSLVIIYSSPETKGHQLYVYDIATPGFVFTLGWHSDPDFDGDGEKGGIISGFIAPDAIVEEEYAAHLTCFVGEGDEGGSYTGDTLIVEGYSLSNSQSPEDDVWNSKSPGLAVPGVDIDTFIVAYPIIEPGKTSAEVHLPTDDDGFMLVYIILSFRSKVASGGTLSYLVR
jgi:hypothetical protein